MSHKNRRRTINIPSERMDELTMIQKPCFSDFYSDKSISFNAKFSSDFISSQYTTATMDSFASYKYQIIYCQLEVNCAKLDNFRKLVSLNVAFPITIGNCRIVPASPTNLTLNLNLRNIKCMMQNTGQSEISITVDQAIYQITKQIQFVERSLGDILI